jgi:hypothetical protein
MMKDLADKQYQWLALQDHPYHSNSCAFHCLIRYVGSYFAVMYRQLRVQQGRRPMSQGGHAC